jgi:hypothetical protein
MKALTYKNKRAPVQGWGRFHETQPRGYAYETDTQFVHVYGAGDGLWVISPGLTISVAKTGALSDWVKEAFGAEDIQTTKLEVGHAVEGIWRPGIFFDTNVLEGLAQKPADLRLAEQRLLLLVQQLDEILLFIEPTPQSLNTFGHKTRELLILACTAVEAQWKYYLSKGGLTPSGQGFRTNDYVNLKVPLYLGEYEISLPRYEAVSPIRPFADWSADKPTQSLSWYESYNLSKHDGLTHLSAATLLSCIEAVAANVAMFSVRFGPHRLYGGGGMLSAAFNTTFGVILRDCDVRSFYVPRLSTEQRGGNLTWGQADPISPVPQKFNL